MDNYTKNNDTVDEHAFVLEYVYLANYFFVIEAILIVPILFGNSLILFSIARFRRLRTRMNILVANLSVSDFLVGLIMIPYDISFVMVEDLRQNKWTCLLRETFQILFLGSSVLNLLLISVERYLAIMFPLAHVHRRSRKWLALLILASWFFAILVSILPLLGVNTWRPGVPCDSAYTLPKEYTIVTNIVLISSLIVNFVLYVRVVHKALSQFNSQYDVYTISKCGGVRHVQNRKKNLLKTQIMIIVLGAFVVCWGPYCIATIVEAVIGESDGTILTTRFLSSFGRLNCGINWIIFGVKNRTYRNAFRYILGCRKGLTENSLMVKESM